MRLNKRWAWIVIGLGLIFMFLTKVEYVRATVGGLKAAKVLMNFETEILQKTPAGQYFEALYWKHNDELIEIARKHPEHAVEFSETTFNFVPELEAFLNGKGDTAYITPDDIESLKAELHWFVTIGSPSLKDDIQRELQRFPLDQFVGMTMNEAYDLVNSKWASDNFFEKSLVSDSNGNWAYYEHNGVYFEYPASYILQGSASQTDTFYLIPSVGMPDYWNPCVIEIRIASIPIDSKDTENPRSWYSSENVLWERQIDLADFPGIAFATISPDYPMSRLQSFQYNEVIQRGVHISTLVYGDAKLTGTLEYSEIEDHRFEYFQHLVASLRIQQP